MMEWALPIGCQTDTIIQEGQGCQWMTEWALTFCCYTVAVGKVVVGTVVVGRIVVDTV